MYVDVPVGFLVLDCNCLPSDLDTSLPSISLQVYISQRNGSSIHDLTVDDNEVELGNIKHIQMEQIFSEENTALKEHEIFPQVGEIWAIYMDWAPEWTPSSVDSCEFAVVEIKERNNASTKVSFLAKVDGYTAVFKSDKQKEVLEIPTEENMRFWCHIYTCFLPCDRRKRWQAWYLL